ncbi:hypothetical protein [Nocardioides sp. cx-173]|uniref:hypothetical protein n=1 Tax=Nocardioides sp. cx-173 TaxID=2898796 RepID=UPI001E3EC6F6|nr:hypothetical protein [Nocardioides sp. cx-173]MCD4523814.1 hypothetical protein [Nocardioides sp. cx-173]UGB41865.1 hypothetical protein LQ940_21265 [Nocardioides sp. cx-173]
MTRARFRGQITGLGSTSGVRVVVGRWRSSPYGAFADAMLERPDGHRVLVAPREDVARLIAATYVFDEVRVEPVEVGVRGDHWRLRSPSLSLEWAVGRRTWLGRVLRCVPRVVAEATWFTVLTDPVARLVLPGVRTRGRARDGREWYGATDHHAVVSLTGSYGGRDLGGLAPIDPSPRFGFSSTPRRPSLTSVVSTVEVGSGR